ncbi:MAG: glycine cleavage system aminomethyltransferase GcvT [Planctomycetaceae bacterium]|nr:glycine cleavage system aminomethyltransferase GcvT [Planctomycetaceae bacterium]
MLQQTPLFDWHTQNHGRMVDFAGWSMPVQYTSIVSEHLGTREGVGLFDVSHMGRITIKGDRAADWLESILTRQVRDLSVGRSRYTLITGVDSTHETVHLSGDPVILDDAIVARLGNFEDGGQQFSLVVNASNRPRVVRWLKACLPQEGVSLHDITEETAMIAVQGPQVFGCDQEGILAGPLANIFSPEILGKIAALKNYGALDTEFDGKPVLVSRSGYTGEDGVEIIVSAVSAVVLWERLLEHNMARPCGLGSRDTLRLEAAMPLYGHELCETTDPFSAGLGFAINVEGRDFPGSDGIRARRAKGNRCRVGLVFDSRRAARSGDRVLLSQDGTESVCGEITSGSFSPTSERGIALAVVDQAVSKPGQELKVVVRGVQLPVKVVSLPFYRRSP